LAAVAVISLVIGGFVLNLLAIAFGARLRIGRGPQQASAAAEFG
jgi:hypothetical protein